MPENGLPIRAYEEADRWHLDFGEGVVEGFGSEEEAESVAEAVAQAEDLTVVVEEQG